MPTAGGSDYYLAAYLRQAGSDWVPQAGARFHSGVAQSGSFPLHLVVAFVVSDPAAAPASVLVSAAVFPASAACHPVDSAPNSRAAAAQRTAPPSPHSSPALSSKPRIGVSVSLTITTADSYSCCSPRLPAPAAAARSTARNPK